MKLTQISVRNFRSYAVGQGGEAATLEVGDGLNLLIGPNNCGKSNLLHAIALALEDAGGAQFNPDADRPQQMLWAYPTITLTFRCDPKASVEGTLLRYTDEYERSAGAATTYASRNDVVFRVVYRTSRREEGFAVAGHPNKKGDSDKLKRALGQFKKCIRFIYVRSGDSLSNFLSGAFRELLHTVLSEHLTKEVQAAGDKRTAYVDDLAKELLEPLAKHALGHLRDLLKEVQGVRITPYVPDLAESLSKADILITDSAETTVLNKGTGVRGALLVALLGYLAKNTRRSLVLAVEEPESFLHPAAQRELRTDLLQLATRPDVTLLVTTHSPFLIDRSASTRVTAFSKNKDGITSIGVSTSGAATTAAAVSSLFDEMITPTVLEAVQPLQAGSKVVLYLEGYTDALYLTAAVKACGREDLLAGLDIRHDEGAFKAAIQALLLRQIAGPALPIGVLLDWDTQGKEARKLLTEKYGWQKQTAMTFRDWRTAEPTETPVEAEDMFEGTLLPGFLAEAGDIALAEKVGFKDGTFHFGLTQAGKTSFVPYVQREVKAVHSGRWIRLLEDIRKRLGLTRP